MHTNTVAMRDYRTYKIRGHHTCQSMNCINGLGRNKIQRRSKYWLIWSDYIYCHVNNCLCGCMHHKTWKTSSADSRLHLEVPIDFCNIAYPPSFQFMIINFIDPPFHQIEHYLRHPQVYETIRINPSQVNNHLLYIQTGKHFLHHEKIKAIVKMSVPG